MVIAAWGGSRAQTQLCPASSRSETRALLRSVARRGSAREPREVGAVVDESRRAARCAAEGGRWLPNETRFQFRQDTRPGSEESSCANTLHQRGDRDSRCANSLVTASPLFPPLQDARGARFVHSASRVPSRALAATFRARRRASRTRRTHAHDPCAESRTPDTTAGTPSVNNPPSSHRCPRLSRARRRTPETTTTSLSRRGAHDGWHTPPPPPPPIRVRVPPTRTSPDRCARPPSTRLSGRKKISLHHSRGNPTEKKDSAPNCRESQV